MRHKPTDYPIPAVDVYYWEQPDGSEALLVKSLQESKLLNTTGRWIWKLCNGKHSCSEILENMVRFYTEVDRKTLAENLDKFLDELLQGGYLVLAEGTAPEDYI